MNETQIETFYPSEIIDLGTLRPWPRNYKIHGDKQSGLLSQSLGDFGQPKNIVVWRGPGDDHDFIVAGHGLVEAATKRGWKRIEVKRLPSSWSLAQVEAYLVADNSLAELSETDPEKLATLLHAIRQENPRMLEPTGYNSESVDKMLKELGNAGEPPPDAEPQVDKAEALQAKWQTAEGQIWQIGPHFVICGDCRETKDWQRLLQAAKVEKVNGVFTSPPYAEQRKDQYGGVPTDQYVEWWDAVQANVKVNLAQDGSFFVNIKAHCEDGQRVLYCMDLVCTMVRKWGWKFFDEWMWNKNGLPGDYGNRSRNDFEPIYHFCLDSITCRWEDILIRGTTVKGSGSGSERQGMGGSNLGKQIQSPGMVRPGNVITTSTDRLGDITGHAAALPVVLPDFFIRAYSDPGDVWLDTFLGSGTTIVAAHNNKRVGLGIEKLPKYLGVILERLQEHVGVEPKLIDESA